MLKRPATSSDTPGILIMSCHKVIGVGKNLTDYVGGLWRMTVLSIPEWDKRFRLYPGHRFCRRKKTRNSSRREFRKKY